ncbi:hypothetical protein [Vibrio parahaemolyticus]|uniref:hypothetical protein n=1 Tax=Vibrio parahaemolyticus TaxID=670 RepID=UPI00226B1C4E|nr:hypothetical protein [Vibrio parahaemolyticus]MCX8816999.1 hypothetical protein [Vibrio parahaemolyticus]
MPPMSREEIDNAVTEIMALRPQPVETKTKGVDPEVRRRLRALKDELELQAIIDGEESPYTSAYYFNNVDPSRTGIRNDNFNIPFSSVAKEGAKS